MATQTQFRRGTTVQHSTFTGAVAEVTVDTDKNTVVVHDGSTAGGFPIAKESSVNDKLQVANANITFVTKATALTSNNALINLINDRIQVANVSTLISTEVAALVDSAPDALNTLNELAAAINDDANFATTITNNIATKASNTYVNTTFVTKSVALSSNNTLVNLINDRLQVANAVATFSTLAQLGNTNSYIASVQSALDTQEAKQAADLANTNSYIADVQTNINVQIGSSNTSIRAFANETFETKSVALAANNAQNSLINDRLQVANAAVLYVTKSTALTSNNTLVNLINDRLQVANATATFSTLTQLGNTNAYIASTQSNLDAQTARIDLVNTNLTSTNTAIRSLVSDRLQVANATSLFVNVSGDTMSGALAMGTNKITGLGTPTDTADAATKGYVDTAVANVVDSAPEALNTLNELAAALGDDANFATTTATTLGTKAANTYVNATFATKAYAAANTYVNAQIGASNTNIRTYANQTFETKSVALSANNAQNSLILDRIQVSNATSTFAAQATQVIAGSGLTGGGTLAANRTLNIGQGTGITVSADAISTNDSQIVHDNLSGFVADEHVAHTGVTITAGAGLTGGGDISASRTINIGAGTGITVSADAISTNDSQIVHDNLSGFVANEHIDHSTVSITAGSGLTGGGTIAATRTINVGAGSYITVAADSVSVDATSSSTVSKVVARDASGNFAGNVITAVDFNATSDVTLKENIVTINNPIEKINTLRGVNFDWKETGKHAMGVIAQEIEQTIPEVVNESEGVKGVNYGSIVGLLIEAIKEQQKQIEKLQQTIESYK